MTINTRSSSKQVETAEQGSLRLNQQNFSGFIEGSDQKFEKLQEQIGLLLQKLSGVMSISEDEVDENVEIIEEELNEEGELTLQSKGMFRDPDHAAKMRQKQANGTSGKKNEELRNAGAGSKEGLTDFHSLKHLKLTFPSLKEGGDAVEWLRDCEECFAIFEVNEARRPAIA